MDVVEVPILPAVVWMDGATTVQWVPAVVTPIVPPESPHPSCEAVLMAMPDEVLEEPSWWDRMAPSVTSPRTRAPEVLG